MTPRWLLLPIGLCRSSSCNFPTQSTTANPPPPPQCGLPQVRTRESNLGNFVCDVIRKAADADVVLVQGGSFRSDV
eukprot:56238-Chlamydomonas_euryale.AAC.1